MEGQPKLEFGDIHYKNCELYKVINRQTLPVTYSDGFYQKIITQYQDLSFLGYYNDICVGSITARKEPAFDKPSSYIMTFGVLEAYQRCGFGTQLFLELLKRIKLDKDIRYVYLHMWEKNEKGYKFYMRQGFEKQQYIKNYYKGIESPHCYVLVLRLFPDEDPVLPYGERDENDNVIVNV